MNQEPDTVSSVLALMPSKDTEIANFAAQVIRSVKSGEVSAIKTQVLMRALEALSELVRDEIEDNVMAEADRYNEKVIELYGALIKKEEVNTRYNYLKTGDLEYEELHAEAQTANRKLKEREEFLKAMKEPQAMISRHGEPYTAQPPFKTSKSGIKIYLKHGK